VLLERLTIHEVVGVGRLARAPLSRCPGSAEPKTAVSVEQPRDDGAFADPSRTEDDENQVREGIL